MRIRTAELRPDWPGDGETEPGRRRLQWVWDLGLSARAAAGGCYAGPARGAPGCCNLPHSSASVRLARSSDAEWWQGQSRAPVWLWAGGSHRTAREPCVCLSGRAAGRQLWGAAGPSHSSPSGGGGGAQPADDKGLYLGFFSQFICRQHGGFLGPGNPPGCWTLGQDAPNASPPCRTTPGHSGKVSAPARPPRRHLQLYVDLIKSAEPRTFRLRRAHSGPQKTDSE